MAVHTRPFEIAIDDDALNDLRHRLEHLSLPDSTPGAGAESGLDMPRVAELAAYWRSSYDWRRHEKRLNSFPQIISEVDGQLVHALYITLGSTGGAAKKRLPVILTHGWPYSFIEMSRLIPYLTDPASDIQLDVVIPSLPGYGFSAPLNKDLFTGETVADLWHRLMTEVLGYERYLTYGEDVGARVSDWIAAKYPQSVAGLYATHAAFPPASRQNNLTVDEQNWVAWLNEKWARASGYARVQSTRPDILATALRDSPVGLMAWIAEKLLAWSGSEPDRYWSSDDLLTTISLYWFSRSIGTSFRPYYEGRHEPELPEISVPVSVAVQYGERGMPRSYAARTYQDIRAWRELEDGGHFTAWQNTEDVATGILGLARLVS